MLSGHGTQCGNTADSPLKRRKSALWRTPSAETETASPPFARIRFSQSSTDFAERSSFGRKAGRESVAEVRHADKTAEPSSATAACGRTVQAARTANRPKERNRRVMKGPIACFMSGSGWGWFVCWRMFPIEPTTIAGANGIASLDDRFAAMKSFSWWPSGQGSG